MFKDSTNRLKTEQMHQTAQQFNKQEVDEGTSEPPKSSNDN